MNYQTSNEIELAVTRYFGVQRHTIVPNVSWGMFPYELDMCVLNHRSRYAYEVEIKISRSDLRRDQKKGHHHDRNGNAIKGLWFAMPKKMFGCEDLVPETAGIMYIDEQGKVLISRKPKSNPVAIRWTFEQCYFLARLGTMRMWTLKRILHAQKAASIQEVK